MKLIFFVLAFVSATKLFAQKEGNTWIMRVMPNSDNDDSTFVKIKCSDTTLEIFFK